jgi:hypothetical protein
MAMLIDKNANLGAHDYGIPPFRLGGIYLAYWTDAQGSFLKVGAVNVQSRDMRDILYQVRQRVLAAVPYKGTRRRPERPRVFVWVVLASNPVLRHELEQAIVDAFGNRVFDPLQMRRGEFCNPEAIVDIAALIDRWRTSLPESLSESLYSEDGGQTYTGPASLLPYKRQTEGLWPEAVDVRLTALHHCIPDWNASRSERRWVVGRDRPVDDLMCGHDSRRVARFHKAMFASPAVPLGNGKTYQVKLPT